MMLDTLGESKAAQAVENAVAEVTGTKLKSMAAGKMGYSTTRGRRPRGRARMTGAAAVTLR